MKKITFWVCVLFFALGALMNKCYEETEKALTVDATFRVADPNELINNN